MAISIIENSGYFFLQTNKSSYVLQKDISGYLLHLYWGAKIKPTEFQFDRFKMYNSTITKESSQNPVSLDTSLFEYPTSGKGDFRSSAIETVCSNGDQTLDLKFKAFAITNQKMKIPGLPSLINHASATFQSLKITLCDIVAEIEVDLFYNVFEEFDAITRHTCVRNIGSNAINLNKVMSGNVEFDKDEYEVLTLSGMYAKENSVTRSPLHNGVHSIESRRGISSHVHNPFLAILEKNATEETGQVYAMNLVYSGNFLGLIESQNVQTVRMQMGLNPHGFSWLLKPKEEFHSPEVVLVQSKDGLGDLSRTFHSFYHDCLNKNRFAKSKRSVLLNSWEGTYMDFDSDKIFSMAEKGKEIGVSLFVLDDGWFGERNDDSSSLGDWFENKKKLPGGLAKLAGKINDLNLQFGLWFEPEMVSENSQLFRAHPDWCFQVPKRERTEQRRQLVLDFTREDVRNNIYDQVSKILKNVPITYVKWDMNRSFTEVFSTALPANQQGEVFHRFVLGLYDFIDKLTKEFPHIFFENCNSGGGRFDPGMLHYFPLTWTSDTTDVIERLSIHHGTSMVYPALCHACHISPSPNVLTGRHIPFETRLNISLFTTGFGFQMNLADLTDDECVQAKEAIKLFDEIEHIVRDGDLYRLTNPPNNDVSWIYVSKDKTEALATWVRVLSKPNAFTYRLKFQGLNPSFVYETKDGARYNGDYLIHHGFQLRPDKHDFASKVFYFKRVKA